MSPFNPQMQSPKGTLNVPGLLSHNGGSVWVDELGEVAGAPQWNFKERKPN